MNTFQPNTTIYVNGPASVSVQSVLYGNDFRAVDRALASLARSAELAIFEGACSRVRVLLGDSSPNPCLSHDELEKLKNAYGHVFRIDYDFFGGNLGSAAGHNRLAESNDCDFLLIRNPDTVVCPRLLELLLATFKIAGVGMVEAKQLPVEHPKDYNPSTGEAEWATTACALIPSKLFLEIGGFDAESFFLYCDDVDFSWQVRARGLKVIFQPDALIFHDKRLSNSGHWQPSAAERYYSAEAALLLAHKWSRQDLVTQYLVDFQRSDNPDLLRAYKTYMARSESNTLPVPVDSEHQVGVFVGTMYSKHRYPL